MQMLLIAFLVKISIISAKSKILNAFHAINNPVLINLVYSLFLQLYHKFSFFHKKAFQSFHATLTSK